MKRWLETHNKDEYPDLSITQENDAFHVLPESRHPSEENIERMCSPGFFSQHKYNYVERAIDFRLKESFEELGNPSASPPYDEPVRDHSQDCVAKVATSNEDLGYACPVNARMRSMDTENEKVNPLYKNSTTASGKEHQNLVYTEQNANTNETHHYAKVTEIGYHSGRSHNKNGSHIAAIGFKDKNNKQEGSESERYPSLSIHNEKQTGIYMETKYQCPRENRGNQVGLKEKGETQSYQSKTEFQEQEGEEEDICGPVALSADLGHNENAILVEVNEAMKNALVEDSVNTKYASLTIHYKKPTGIPKEKEDQFLIEHSRNQADLTEKDETQSYQSRKIKLQHEQEENEEVIYDFVIRSSDLEHNENAILEDVGKQEQTAEKNADSVNTKYPSLTIHYKEPTGVSTEPGRQPLTEHSRNQADMTEKDETQLPVQEDKIATRTRKERGNYWRFHCPKFRSGTQRNPKRLHSHEPGRWGKKCKARKSRQSEAKRLPRGKCENDIPARGWRQCINRRYPVTQTLCTEKMKEDDHAAQSVQPTGEGTECEVPHQPSRFRRTRTIWRKRRSPETEAGNAMGKNLGNKQNAALEYDSEKEVVRKQVLKEVNEQDRTEEQNLSNQISPCLLQGSRWERHISTWDKEFSEIEMNLDI